METDPKDARTRHEQALGDPDAATRRRAIEALIELDAAAGGLSSDQLADPHEQQPAASPGEAEASRDQARDRAPAGDLAIAGVLLIHLPEERDEANRISIIEYLGKKLYAPAIEPLEHVRQNKSMDRGTIEAANNALQTIREHGTVTSPEGKPAD